MFFWDFFLFTPFVIVQDLNPGAHCFDCKIAPSSVGLGYFIFMFLFVNINKE
jgi:hypothetical protein